MDPKKINVDVLICGGGPAGISAAYTLGKNGINTLIIDRKEKDQIGNKVCGDALSPQFTDWAYNEVGLPKPNPETKELMEVAEEIVLRGMDPKAQITIGKGSVTVDRLRYGQALLKATEKFESVKIYPNMKVKEVIVKNNNLKGIIAINKNEEYEIYAKVTIDATGSRGVVRGRLPLSMCEKFPQKLPKEEMLVAYREIIRTKTPHQFQKGLYLVFEPEMKDVMPGYYWFFSRGERELNIGLGYMKYERNLGKNIRSLNDKVRNRYFPDCEILASQGDQIPARLPLPSLVHNGFIAVGDAGALANPMNGEGHGQAIFSGIKAAQYIIKALSKSDWSERGLWNYNRDIWKTCGVEFAMGIAVVKFVNKYSYDEFDNLLAKQIIREEDILNYLTSPKGKAMSLFKRILKIIYKPKILLGLKRTLDLNDKIKRLAENYPDFENFEKWNNELNKVLETKV